MDSFYGGKQGIDFVLRGAFSSVNEMVTAFKQGPSYTDIWYNEYCIIDTPNKNDKDNGKIYRRGLEYQNSLGGAIYVGQIVGPSSGTPYFQLLSIDDVQKIAEKPLEEYQYRRYPYDYDEENEVYLTTDSDSNPIQTFSFNREYDETLVPGKYEDDSGVHYNDDIKYTWCNIRDDNADSDSWFYVGWQQPFLVVDYKIHMVSPYDENGDVLTDATEIERIDDNTHPFYEQWDLGLPKGIKGDTLRNLRVIVPTNNDRNKIYSPSAITVNPTTGESTVGAAGYDGIDDDIAAGRQIVVFDYYIYDKLLNPSPIMIYLGDFNIITSINVDDEGTLTVEYTHNDDTVFTKKIRWVNGVALTEGNGTAGGHITFTFNNDSPSKTQEFDISWIKGIEIEEDGSLIYSYAGTPEVENMPENANPVMPNGTTADPSRTSGFYRVEDFLQWIHNVNLNNQNGHFYVTNNRDETIFETDLDWIRDIQFTEDGSVTLVHTSEDNFTYTNLIKWIDNVTLNQSTGQFTIDWNYGEDSVTQLDWTDDIYINESDGNIYIHHTNQALNEDVPTGSAPFASAELLDAHLKLITRASVSTDGIVTFTCNTGETIQLNQASTGSTPFRIKVIEDITLNTGIRDDKHIFVKYNTESAAEAIGDPINYIEDTVVRASDWHLLVLYSDPSYRYPNREGDEDHPLDEDTHLDQYGVAWYNNIQGSASTSPSSDPYYAADIYWRDMGAIKDQAGLLIGMNVDSSQVEEAGYDAEIAGTAGTVGDGSDGTGVCGYLQKFHSNGLNGNDNEQYGMSLTGKVVTYSPPVTTDNPDKQNKEFYAYDYNTRRWFFLGTLSDMGMRDAMLSTPSVTNVELNKLTSKGLLFKRYDVTYADRGIPTYWDPSSTLLNG